MEKNFEIKDGVAKLKIHSDIYPKEVVVQTTYVMLDDFYFLIDKDGDYFIVTIKVKSDEGGEMSDARLEKGVYEFFDELIESQSYLDQLKRTSKIREVILEKALLNQTVDDEVLEKIRTDD